MTPIQIGINFIGKPSNYTIINFWNSCICRIFGLRVNIKGQPIKKEQGLLVCNHISYLDVIALGSFLHASFIAKEDVAKWPVFGFLTKVHRTIFISRDPRKAKNIHETIDKELSKGHSLILFPEGTSSNGATVLPFKSSLFGLTMNDDPNAKPVIIQPVTIKPVSVDAHPIENDNDRNMYAWHGDMTLMPHLWAFSKSKGATVQIEFHPTINTDSHENRKTLARHCQEIVADGLAVNA